MNEYLSYDKQTIGQISLEEICSSLERMKCNFHLLQYMVISFHSALQCYMTVALRGSSGINTWKKTHAKKWLKAFQNNEELPDVQLDYFMELYDKLYKNVKEINRRDINYLNETRNEFIHFVSDGFATHIPSILCSCKAALEAILLTPQKSKGIFFYEDEQEEKFYKTCNKIKDLLNDIEQQFNDGEFIKEYFLNA